MSDVIRRLIVNADDFGASSGINGGIVEAVDAGVVTSASLMVNMPAARDAVAAAAARPRLSLGIHVNLTFEGGPPIVDFDDRAACGSAIRSQIETFTTMVGRHPTHVDAHHNIHRDPRLAPLFRSVAADLGVPLREHGSVRYFSSFYGRWDGTTHPEQISVESLLDMVGSFDAGPTELACHPGRPEADFVSDYHVERTIELETLLSPGLQGRLVEQGVRLCSYHDITDPGWRTAKCVPR